MKQNNSIFILGSLLFFILLRHGAFVTAQEVEDESEFEYAEGSERGPQRWGELKKEWEACKNGVMQSPIDLSNKRVKIVQKMKVLETNYKPYTATLKNRGHDISIQWELGEAGSIKINGTEYFLQQGHWHSSSEHSINGKRYAMEMHLVHVCLDEKVEDKIVVIGLLYEIGQPDSFLSKLMENISSMADKKQERKMGVIDPREITMGGEMTYRYMGSLTVPPCTEGVTWIINKQVGTVAKDQVKLLREAVHDYAEENARPLQAHNSREIHLHAP